MAVFAGCLWPSAWPTTSSCCSRGDGQLLRGLMRRDSKTQRRWSEGHRLSGRPAGALLCALCWSVCLSDPWGMSSRGLTLARPAKNVVVYRNGDPFFHGRKFVVNQRQFLTFEAFLNEVTKSIHAPLAVRNLYTPKHGHRVAELVDLQDGCQYVAAGFEKFKRLDYLNHGRKELRGTNNSNSVQTCTAAPWKPNTAVRQQKPTHLTVHVFRNGDLLSPPFQLMISKSTLWQWDTLLVMLTEKADLCSGAVNRLCRLDGTLVSSGEELVNGNYYVAVGTEEYKKLPYLELLVPQDSGCRTHWHGLQANHKPLSQGKGMTRVLKMKSTG